MDSRTNLHINIVVLIVSVIAFGCLGQQEETEEASPSVGEPNAVALPAFPYAAEIVSDNVYVRSGPGTNYYRCGKLGRGDVVEIVGASSVWSQISPPKDSFSWISKQYVTIDAANPDTGTVTGDQVRVYAGSSYYEPIHSDQVQVQLKGGDKVALMGEEMGDYYKIAPPSGAFFWVSTQYTSPAGVTAAPAVAEPTPAAPAPTQAPPAAAPEPTAPSPAVVPTTMPVDSERLKQYYDVQDSIKAEFKKALVEQDYSTMRKQLDALIKANDSDRAARYAKFALLQIQRYELAALVAKEAELQDIELNLTFEKITQAHDEKLAGFRDLGRFAAIGKFQASNIYGPEEVLLHYILVDDKGKVICYALPTGGADQTDLSSFIDQQVGLVGQIEPHPQTAGALVRFTEIQPVK
jgi:uncharacterized protein YgiM (DUF1202 family)